MKIIFFSNSEKKEVDNVTSVNFTGDNGNFTILENHYNLISLLTKGDFKYIDNNKKESIIKIESGLINIFNNIINVIILK